MHTYIPSELFNADQVKYKTYNMTMEDCKSPDFGRAAKLHINKHIFKKGKRLNFYLINQKISYTNKRQVCYFVSLSMKLLFCIFNFM